MAVHREDEEKVKIIQECLTSGLNITDYCKKRTTQEGDKKLGAVTLLGWFEDKGYKMTPANSEASEHVVSASKYEALKAEYNEIFDRYTNLLRKHDREKYNQAIMLID